MQMQKMEKITIMGFGNPVREDDAVGVYVVQQLQKQLKASDNLQIFDMGTAAFEILFKLKGQDRIILIDAVVNTQDPVGTLYKLPASEINAKIQDDPLLFLHSLKWDQALSYAKKILGRDYPENIEVYLIAINNTKFNTQMTAEAKAGADRLVQILAKEVAAITNQS